MENNGANFTSEPELRVRKSSTILRNRKKILRAAQEVLGEVGPEVSNDAIASHAGVSVSTLYMHFTNRQELVRASLMDALRTWERWVLSHFSSLEPSIANAVLSARLLMRIQATHPIYYRLLQRNLSSTGLLYDELSQAFRASVLAVVDSGEFSVEHVDLRLSALEGAIYGILGRQLKNPEVEIWEADRALELALALLGFSTEQAKKLAQSPLPTLNPID